MGESRLHRYMCKTTSAASEAGSARSQFLRATGELGMLAFSPRKNGDVESSSSTLRMQPRKTMVAEPSGAQYTMGCVRTPEHVWCVTGRKLRSAPGNCRVRGRPDGEDLRLRRQVRSLTRMIANTMRRGFTAVLPGLQRRETSPRLPVTAAQRSAVLSIAGVRASTPGAPSAGTEQSQAR